MPSLPIRLRIQFDAATGDRIYLPMLLFVMTVAVSVRLGVTFFTGLPWISGDTAAYFNMADAILAGHPDSRFPNGYPLLIAAIKLVCKPEWVATVLVSLQVVLSSLTVGMVADIARKLTNSAWVAGAAGLCAALYPNQINYVRQLMSEVPTAFLLTGSVFLLVRRRYFFSGVLLYLAIVFRSSLLPILPLFIVCALLHPGARERITFAQGKAFLGGCGVCLALYAALLTVGTIKPASNLGCNLLIAIRSESHQGIYFKRLCFTPEEQQYPLRTYLRFARDNPGRYVKQRISSLQELWGWPCSSGATPRSLLTRMLIAVRIPLGLLAIMAFCRRRRAFDAWVLILPIVVITVVHVAMFSTARFTFVVEPLLIVLAALWWKKELEPSAAKGTSALLGNPEFRSPRSYPSEPCFSDPLFEQEATEITEQGNPSFSLLPPVQTRLGCGLAPALGFLWPILTPPSNTLSPIREIRAIRS